MKRARKYWTRLPHPIRWVVAATVGTTILIIGIILLVLPGPGIPLIVVGLAILATEFAWAEYLLTRTKNRAQKIASRIRKR